ncbi:MAG: TolC family protein [Deltaproteobacteria bacterium]|nr:TolC family protein [Deltaproteobacteria bacterium]
MLSGSMTAAVLAKHPIGAGYLAGWLMCTVCLFGISACATTVENAARRDLNRHAEETSSAAMHHSRPVESVTPDGTLAFYIAYAMKNSPELAAQFERWRASVYRISGARRLPDPVVSYGYYISRVETRVGPQRHRVSLKQTFPWPTRLSAGADAAAARATSNQDKFDAMAVEIAARVEQIYWQIWKIQEARKVQEAHEASLFGLSESANAMMMTGRIDLSEQQQIDLARARIDDTLSMLDEQAVQQKAELRALISAPKDIEMPVSSTPNLEPTVLDEVALLSSVKSHPSLRAYDALAQSSALDAKKEETTRYPNFTVGVDWIETGKAENPNTPDSGKDAFVAGIGVSIPLWQQSYQESVAAYHAEENAHMSDGEAATDRAVATFYQTLSQIRDAERRMALYEKTLVPQAESVYESVLGAYASGRGSVASALLAQQDLLELRLQLISVQSDYLTKMAALKNLVGHEVGDSP